MNSLLLFASYAAVVVVAIIATVYLLIRVVDDAIRRSAKFLEDEE